MAAVIPKDLTGLVPHPTKMDCWIPGEHSNGNNLCMEIPLPTGSETMTCALGVPNLSKLTHNHLTQIQMELWNNRGGGPEGKIINSFYSGATPDQLMSRQEVIDHADDLIHYLGDAKKASDYIDSLLRDIRHHIIENDIMPYEMPPKKSTMEVYDEISLDWKTQIYNHVVKQYGGKISTYLQGVNKDTLLPQIAVEEFAKIVIDENDGDARIAADILKAAMTEHITLMSAMAMNQAMKEKGLMGEITKVTDKMIEQVNTKGAENEELARLLGGEGHRPDLDLMKQIADVPSVSQVTTDEVKHLDPGVGTIERKKKKSKRQPKHLPNMKNRSVKRALGASILTMLGNVQRDTQDAQKRALLKELPAADIIEMATGQKLPDYQANLINAAQAKADPEAPVVKRMNATKEEVLEQLQDEVVKVNQLTTEFEQSLEDNAYEKLLDETLDKYVTRDLVPVEITDEQFANMRASIKAAFLEQRKVLTEKSVTVAPTGQVDIDISTGMEFTPVNVTFIGDRVRDLRIEADSDSWLIHYERFTEDTADELKSTIAYVEERIATDEFYKGLKECVTETLSLHLPLWRQQYASDEIYQLIGKVVATYTAGYVQAFVQKEHKDRQATAQPQAADLG